MAFSGGLTKGRGCMRSAGFRTGLHIGLFHLAALVLHDHAVGGFSHHTHVCVIRISAIPWRSCNPSTDQGSASGLSHPVPLSVHPRSVSEGWTQSPWRSSPADTAHLTSGADKRSAWFRFRYTHSIERSTPGNGRPCGPSKVEAQHFFNLETYRKRRVQRCHGLLKDHGDLAADQLSPFRHTHLQKSRPS